MWIFCLLSLIVQIFQVDGDELTGLCLVGNLRPKSFLWFVVVPLAVILFFGTLFIIVGFVALCKIRSAIKQGFLQPPDGEYMSFCFFFGFFDLFLPSHNGIYKEFKFIEY